MGGERGGAWEMLYVCMHVQVNNSVAENFSVEH